VGNPNGVISGKYCIQSGFGGRDSFILVAPIMTSLFGRRKILAVGWFKSYRVVAFWSVSFYAFEQPVAEVD